MHDPVPAVPPVCMPEMLSGSSQRGIEEEFGVATPCLLGVCPDLGGERQEVRGHPSRRIL